MAGSAPRKVITWWEASFYPAAGEATAWGNVQVEDVATTRRAGSAQDGEGGDQVENTPGEHTSDSAERAARRVRAKLRRYCAANKLDRLLVLTFAEPVHDLAEAQRRSRLWIKRELRPRLKGPRAYVVGWERHKSGAWHVNVVLGSYVAQPVIRRTWGRGHVWIERFRSTEGGREAARQAGRYVAKYVTKDLAGMPKGQHRYEVGQGAQPAMVRLYAGSWSGVWHEAIRESGRVPGYIWRAPIGTGPPIGFLSW